MEIWDIYNKNKELTGKKRVRGTELEEDEYHLVAIVWLKTIDGRFLISKRSGQKIGGGMWETTGGSALEGENSLQAAIREVGEEVGLTITPDQIRFLKTVRHGDTGGWFADYWYVEKDIDINKIVCQASEVDCVKWASRDEILKMIENKEFFHGEFHLKALFQAGLL